MVAFRPLFLDSALGVVGRFPFLNDSMLLVPELPHPDEVEERVRRQQWAAWHRALAGDEWCRFRRLGLPVRPALPVVVDYVRALLWAVVRSCRNRATHKVTSTLVRFEPGFLDPAARPSWPWFSRRADEKCLRPLARIRIPESAPALHPTSSSVAA
jgi:hypothetical protein